MVKPGAIIIDAGINKVAVPGTKDEYKIVGDVAYEDVLGKVAGITPVPRGVGPMTVALLLENTIKAC